MKYNTQNAKIKSITEKTLIIGIDVGSETHFARAFDWRNYEYSKKPLEFSNNEAGFVTFKAWTAAIRESKEKELADIQNRIEEFNQSIQQELQQQQSQLMAPIQKKAVEAVNKLAKEGGYIYVFEQGSLLYFDASQSTDLTPAARKALNIPASRTLESLQQELQAQAQK